MNCLHIALKQFESEQVIDLAKLLPKIFNEEEVKEIENYLMGMRGKYVYGYDLEKNKGYFQAYRDKYMIQIELEGDYAESKQQTESLKEIFEEIDRNHSKKR